MRLAADVWQRHPCQSCGEKQCPPLGGTSCRRSPCCWCRGVAPGLESQPQSAPRRTSPWTLRKGSERRGSDWRRQGMRNRVQCTSDFPSTRSIPRNLRTNSPGSPRSTAGGVNHQGEGCTHSCAADDGKVTLDRHGSFEVARQASRTRAKYASSRRAHPGDADASIGKADDTDALVSNRSVGTPTRQTWWCRRWRGPCGYCPRLL